MSKSAIEKLEAMSKDCLDAAEIYQKSPGLAGHGVNAGTVIDIYRRLSIAIDDVVAALSETRS